MPERMRAARPLGRREAAVEVEIWSDIACPWCYIGKRRFERALERFEHRDEVRVRWRSFELDPSAPPEWPGDRAERLAAKYGITVEQARSAERQMAQVAAGEGLDFRFDLARSGSTLDGHRLLHLAREHRLADAMKERLLRAQFTEGQLVSDPATLTELALAVGLPEREVADVLGGERHLDEVRADELAASELGIGAVPTFLIDRAVGVSGAQDPELLLELLRRGWQRAASVTPAARERACSRDGC
jgi:predicted DsbA family dithiol-disulfide isomerase